MGKFCLTIIEANILKSQLIYNILKYILIVDFLIWLKIKKEKEKIF